MTNTMKKVLSNVSDRGLHDWNRAQSMYKYHLERLQDKTNTPEQFLINAIRLDNVVKEMGKARDATKLAYEAATGTFEYNYSIKELMDEVNVFRSVRPIKFKEGWTNYVTTNKANAIVKLLWISYWFKEAEAIGSGILFREPSYDWTVVDKQHELDGMNIKFKFDIGNKTLTINF